MSAQYAPLDGPRLPEEILGFYAPAGRTIGSWDGQSRDGFGLALVLLVSVVPSSPAASAATPPSLAAPTSSDRLFVPDEIVVRFKASTTPTERADTRDDLGGTVAARLEIPRAAGDRHSGRSDRRRRRRRLRTRTPRSTSPSRTSSSKRLPSRTTRCSPTSGRSTTPVRRSHHLFGRRPRARPTPTSTRPRRGTTRTCPVATRPTWSSR